jgi:hypothetical protein
MTILLLSIHPVIPQLQASNHVRCLMLMLPEPQDLSLVVLNFSFQERYFLSQMKPRNDSR